MTTQAPRTPMGVHVGGAVFAADGGDVDTDEFTDALIALCESRGWHFGGVTRPIAWDEDPDEAAPRAERQSDVR